MGKTYVTDTQYNKTLNKIDANISALKNALREHKRTQMKNLTGPGSVGFINDVLRVNEGLEELVKFLTGN